MVSGHAPQTGYTQEERECFNENLKALIKNNILSIEQLDVGADISGHVGTDAEGYEDGGQGFGDRNDRGGRTIIGNCPGFESGHTSRKQKSTE